MADLPAERELTGKISLKLDWIPAVRMICLRVFRPIFALRRDSE